MNEVASANHDMAMIYHNVFSTHDGRLVLDHILNQVCLINTPIMTTSDINMASQVGARNIGLIIKQMALAPLTGPRPTVLTKKETA